MYLQAELKKHIKKLSFSLKSGKELELALKAKLTKKELKMLKALAQNSTQNLKKQLNLNENDFKALFDKMVKKINQEKVKQELYER